MDRRERVIRAIEFDRSDRRPLPLLSLEENNEPRQANRQSERSVSMTVRQCSFVGLLATLIGANLAPVAHARTEPLDVRAYCGEERLVSSSSFRMGTSIKYACAKPAFCWPSSCSAITLT